jgi:hypothetical protein
MKAHEIEKFLKQDYLKPLQESLRQIKKSTKKTGRMTRQFWVFCQRFHSRL